MAHSIKQLPVLDRLGDTLTLALAYAAAIRDNAQDDGQPICPDLASALQADCTTIISCLAEASNV